MEEYPWNEQNLAATFDELEIKLFLLFFEWSSHIGRNVRERPFERMQTLSLWTSSLGCSRVEG